MNYRGKLDLPIEYVGVVCNLCGSPPKTYGILGWVFEENRISCLECRKQGTEDKSEKPISLHSEKTFNRIYIWFRKFLITLPYVGWRFVHIPKK